MQKHLITEPKKYGFRLLCYRCGDIAYSKEGKASSESKKQSPWDYIYPKEIFIYWSFTKSRPALPNGRCVFRWRGGGSPSLEAQPYAF